MHYAATAELKEICLIWSLANSQGVIKKSSIENYCSNLHVKITEMISKIEGSLVMFGVIATSAPGALSKAWVRAAASESCHRYVAVALGR